MPRSQALHILNHALLQEAMGERVLGLVCHGRDVRDEASWVSLIHN